MKHRSLTGRLFVLVLLLVALTFVACNAVSARAAAASTQHFSFHGLSAIADFDSFNGSVETFAEVEATSTKNQITANVTVDQSDTSNGTDLIFASGSTSSATFTVGGQFSSATLSATIPVFDHVSGTTFNVSVNVNWTATGVVLSESGTSRTHTKGFTQIDHFVAKFRDASAAGTISDGTTNYSPDASLFAQIGQFSQGDVTIQTN